MPYTPPSHRSPASSASASPDASRRPSIQSGTTGRPSLPRSASYLNKHRRTPSLASSDGGVAAPLTPQGTSENLQALIGLISPSVRQSPPPVSNDRGMPKGAIISPPDSASSGSDDEGPEIRGRKLTNLKDLRDAVSQISQSQPREHSPTKEAGAADDEHVTPKPLVISFSTSALGDISKLGRRGHVRSSTEPNAPIIIQSAGNSVSTSEEDSDDDLRKKPQMVRKKSGELVRPALRPPSRRRPSSMPGTPVFSKAVHFDSHLEHVRHFLQVDRPLAVSAGSSPVEAYDSDTEYPFPNSDDRRPGVRSPPHEWEMLTPNFPHDAHARSTLPVRLEKVWLSPDQKSLLGSVAVANLAFQKSVLCRFTLDYWKTTSEVAAEYSHEIRPKETPVNYDRFTFSIKLSDMANLETKTLFFCIRYAVNGQEYWDNNNHANFQVDFRKKYLPMNGKRGNQGAASRPLNGALPRSNRRQNAPAAPRPKSMPVAFDDFGDDSKFDFDQPIHAYLGESGSTGLRLKSRSSSNLASDNLTKDLSSPSGAAFANRYDFGASLSAAVQAAKDSMSREKDRDALYMKDHVRGSPATSSNKTATTTATAAAAAVSAIPGTSSPIPGLPSSSYEELVNKYCFFGSKQSSPVMKDGTLKSRFDGEDLGTGSTNSSAGSPQMGYHHTGGATHHAMGWYSSPRQVAPILGSPLRSFSPSVDGSQSSTPKATGSSSASGASPMFMGPSNDYPFAQQQPIAERFPWSPDSHTATAILG